MTATSKLGCKTYKLSHPPPNRQSHSATGIPNLETASNSGTKTSVVLVAVVVVGERLASLTDGVIVTRKTGGGIEEGEGFGRSLEGQKFRICSNSLCDFRFVENQKNKEVGSKNELARQRD
ncbi:hypothetical protein L1887_13598 [Cichorium endivia]|nr:hypothetical protein L1887_13598 [Cichorium endivia]